MTVLAWGAFVILDALVAIVDDLSARADWLYPVADALDRASAWVQRYIEPESDLDA